MRLKKDRHSWRAGGVIRRDFRHQFAEQKTTYPKPAKKGTRKRIRHKHIWVQDEIPFVWSRAQIEYWLRTWGYDPTLNPTPKRWTTFHCSEQGCTAHKFKQNLRYGYEYYKWRKATRR
jgi:hypothetical protein